jgi:MoaA/NifB/PqqE/SkfB family radical SAM enzyme
MSSYQLSKLTGKPVQWGFPYQFLLSLQLHAIFAARNAQAACGNFKTNRYVEKDFFTETIDDVYKDLLYLIFYFQGEPFLNPDFLDMVKYAHDKGIYTATSTNAHYLTDEKAKKTVESGLDRLIISIDGTTQDVYQQYRVGGKLEKVLEGARIIVKWKKELKSKTPFVFFQFLVVKPNEHQIEDIKKLAKEVGVDQVRFKTAQVYDYENDPNH